MSSEDDDKPFEATQKRLDDARAKGEVPRSADVTTAAGYGGFLLAATVMGPASIGTLGTILERLLSAAGSPGATKDGWPLGAIAAAVAPWFVLPAALALLSLLAQRGLVFAPSKLAFKGSRISPLKTAGQKFGRTGLFEFGKSLAKLVLYAVTLGLYLSQRMPRILLALELAPGQVAAEIGALCLGLVSMVLVIAVALGLADLVWQHAEHARRHRMSRQEMIDETKQSEGDPALRQQRRQKGISIAMNRMLADVPKADVIVVNPTHYAVALRWDRKSGRAPVCVAKGVDEVAARIRSVAQEHGIPIHADPPTARALHASLEIGDEVQSQHYRAVAAAIRFAEAMRARAHSR
ncbi:MAG: flagellar type III secretion system protein FlhB [Limimaricola sp.]|uniref:EscU/YscU/HrcU family type III secretion system export apparatus switch protein n=1 Tax=Limimaricola sp. TaxID=2211665 RepID=UPI001D8C6B7D|nr:flagellar type III secretion system protein FlhB [Limimaricola sp.]MBI1417343.1 flagellar type III secretion system protein FlhB [Limimaricola sp.]